MGFFMYKKTKKKNVYLYKNKVKSMKLKLKKEYLDYSIITKNGKIYLGNLDPEKYSYYYKSGYSIFFDVLKEKKEVEPLNDELKININEEDDTNK